MNMKLAKRNGQIGEDSDKISGLRVAESFVEEIILRRDSFAAELPPPFYQLFPFVCRGGRRLG